MKKTSEVDLHDAYLALPYVVFAQTLALMTSVKLNNKPDNPSPEQGNCSTEVVQGVTIHK